jgi:hypothetical protein
MLGLVVAVARTLLELLIVWQRTHLGRGQQSAPATCGDSTLAVCYSKLVNNVLQPGPATAAPSVDRQESAILASSVAREQACSTQPNHMIYKHRTTYHSSVKVLKDRKPFEKWCVAFARDFLTSLERNYTSTSEGNCMSYSYVPMGLLRIG